MSDDYVADSHKSAREKAMRAEQTSDLTTDEDVSGKRKQ